MRTIDISPNLHFRDIVKQLNLNLSDESSLYILPDIPSIVQAEDVFIDNGGIWGERILTFGKLAHLSNLYSDSISTYLSRTGRLLVMEELLEKSTHEMSYFTDINNTREFSDSLLKVIAELKHSGIDYSRFREITEQVKSEPLHIKFKDFLLTYSQYSDYLEKNGYIDDIDSLGLLTSNINTGTFRQLFPEIQRVIVFGFNEFTDSQQKVLNALSDSGIKVDVLSYLKPDDISSDSADIHSFQSVTEEVYYCAKEISRLLSADGIEPSDIAVVVSSLTEYSNLIECEFNKFGIRYSQSAVHTLNSSSIGNLITELLLLKITGFRKLHLFNILRNPLLVALSVDNIEMTVDTAKFELNSRKSKVTHGIENWKTLIKSSDNKQSIKFKKFVSRLLDLVDKKFGSKKIGMLNRDLLSILDEIVYDIIRKNNFPESMSEYNATVSAFILLKEYNFLINKTFSNRTTDNLNHYLRLITDLMSEGKYSLTGEHKNDQLKVLSLLEARGTRFKYIFLLGASENRLPNPVRRDPVIKDHERYILNNNFKTNILKTAKEIHDTETRLLNLTIKHAERIKISFVRIDNSGIPVQPAFMFNDLYKESGKLVRDDFKSEDFLKYAHSETDVFNFIYANQFFNDTGITEILPVNFKYCSNGISSESQRLRRFASLSETEGVIDAESALSCINTFTVTELESYGDCPFRYYASKILKLNFPDEISEEPEPLDLGSIYHDILFGFFYELSNKAKIKLDPGKIKEDELMPKLKAFLDSYNLENMLKWLPLHRVKLAAQRIREYVIPSFISNEFERIRENNSEGIYPEFYEKDLEYVIDKDTVIKGKSDRIDTSSDKAIVIDYKFGAVSNRKFSDYRNLQLPLYLLALKNMNYDSLGGYYRSIEKADDINGKKPGSKNFYEDLENAENFARLYIRNIRSGRFPADPENKDLQSINSDREIMKKSEAPCTYCDFSDLCRANHRVFRRGVYGE